MPRKANTSSANYNKPFPTALRNLMETNRTTQSELAAHVKKTRQAISRYCDGSASPPQETVADIARFYGVSANYLLGLPEINAEDDGRFPTLRKRLVELQGERTQEEFAQEIGISRQTMGFYLRGERIPDSKTLLRICEECNVSADWLLGLSEAIRPDTELQAVCAYTGLSEDSVSLLHERLYPHKSIAAMLSRIIKTVIEELTYERDSFHH